MLQIVRIEQFEPHIKEFEHFHEKREDFLRLYLMRITNQTIYKEV